MLNHIQLAEALNYFYMYAHWTITPLFFIWLYRGAQRVYPYVRNAFFAANGIALIVFMVYPVAPPRLVGAATASWTRWTRSATSTSTEASCPAGSTPTPPSRRCTSATP